MPSSRSPEAESSARSHPCRAMRAQVERGELHLRPAPCLRSLGLRLAISRGAPKGRLSGHRNTSFFYACEVSCRVRAERVKPYASQRWRFTPRTCQVQSGSPAPRRHPGARRLGILLSLGGIRLGQTVVNTLIHLFTRLQRAMLLAVRHLLKQGKEAAYPRPRRIYRVRP